MKQLVNSTDSNHGSSWVNDAVRGAGKWANVELENGLARFSLLWFAGRQGQSDKMQLVLDQVCSWLERNPNHTFVRWATTWLAGLCLYSPAANRVIEMTASWLNTAKTDDERIVRMGFLWLVGASGNNLQVDQAMKQTASWLDMHPEDDFVRIAYLLFLMRRKGTPQQRRQAIEKTRKWQRNHADIGGLTQFALMLSESAPN